MKGEENKLTKLKKKMVHVFYGKWADRSLSGNLDINLSKQAKQTNLPQCPFFPFLLNPRYPPPVFAIKCVSPESFLYPVTQKQTYAAGFGTLGASWATASAVLSWCFLCLCLSSCLSFLMAASATSCSKSR